MTETPVVLRDRALRDVEVAVEHYLGAAPADLALAFIDALDAAFQRMREQPGGGSRRYARALDLPGLRSSLLTAFPYLVFYVEGEAALDVWRILHAPRAAPAWLQEPLDD